MSFIKDQIKIVFHDYEMDDQNPIVRHDGMTLEHEEILGQFLDLYTDVDPERLKRVLVNGYLF